MKTDFENSIRRLSFLCRQSDIKNAWINPCLPDVFPQLELSERALSQIVGKKYNLPSYILHFINVNFLNI